MSFVGLLDGQCVQDRAFGRLLGNQMKLPKQNTPQLCADECYDNHYKYAWVQYASQCFCGDEPPPDSPHVPAGECINATHLVLEMPTNSVELIGE